MAKEEGDPPRYPVRKNRELRPLRLVIEHTMPDPDDPNCVIERERYEETPLATIVEEADDERTVEDLIVEWLLDVLSSEEEMEESEDLDYVDDDSDNFEYVYTYTPSGSDEGDTSAETDDLTLEVADLQEGEVDVDAELRAREEDERAHLLETSEESGNEHEV
jgi:hypothetical protein